MDAFHAVNFTSDQLEVQDISTPPNDLPLDRQEGSGGGMPCIIA